MEMPGIAAGSFSVFALSGQGTLFIFGSECFFDAGCDYRVKAPGMIEQEFRVLTRAQTFGYVSIT